MAADRYWVDRYLSPAEYIQQRLKAKATPAQLEILRLLRTPPYKVLVKSGHDTGKSWIAATAANWFFDSFTPGVVLTTAPNAKQVQDILWKEIRKQRLSAGLDTSCMLPKACRMETGPDHFAHGFTARDRTGFHGQHEAAVLIIFDEAEGVAPQFWDAAQTMLQGDNYGWLCLYNPYTQSGPAVEAERSGGFHVVTMSCLDHPNVQDELAGRVPEFPAAVRLAWVKDRLADWSDRADPETPGAVEFDGQWYLPGPKAEAGILGRRPAAGINAVFPEYLFDEALKRSLPLTGPLQIGVDVAWEGDDDTAIHVRKGGVSLHHESFNGQNTVRTVERVLSLVGTWGGAFNLSDPMREVILAVDVVGIGAGVFDQLREKGCRRAVRMNTLRALTDREDYPNLRSALWFGFAEECRRGNIALGGLGKEALSNLRRELTAPVYWIDVRGRRTVEPKDETKRRIGRSPDNADSILLAFANVGMSDERVLGRVEVP